MAGASVRAGHGADSQSDVAPDFEDWTGTAQADTEDSKKLCGEAHGAASQFSSIGAASISGDVNLIANAQGMCASVDVGNFDTILFSLPRRIRFAFEQTSGSGQSTFSRARLNSIQGIVFSGNLRGAAPYLSASGEVPAGRYTFDIVAECEIEAPFVSRNISYGYEIRFTEIVDWNQDGAINSADFFAFLVDFFGGSADFNGDGTTNSQDFFEFLNDFLDR